MTQQLDIQPGDPGYNKPKAWDESATIQAAVNELNEINERFGVELNGKKYTMVHHRVGIFRKYFGHRYSVQTFVEGSDDATLRVKAVVTKDTIVGSEVVQQIIGTGHAEKPRGRAALEKTETAAIGRALASIGLAGSEYASANEMEDVVAQETPAPAPQQTEPAAPPVEDVPFDTDDWAAWVKEQCNQLKGITQMSKLEAWKRSTARTRNDLERASKSQWNILAKEYTEIFQQLNTGVRHG